MVRYQLKSFAHLVPHGKGGGAWNLKGVRKVIYRLLDLLEADRNQWVFIPEEERHVDKLRQLGVGGHLQFGRRCKICGGRQACRLDNPLRRRVFPGECQRWDVGTESARLEKTQDWSR